MYWKINYFPESVYFASVSSMFGHSVSTVIDPSAKIDSQTCQSIDIKMSIKISQDVSKRKRIKN